MQREEQLATRVTEDEKTAFRVEAAKQGMDMSEYLRRLVYDELESKGHETSQEAKGNGNAVGKATAD